MDIWKRFKSAVLKLTLNDLNDVLPEVFSSTFWERIKKDVKEYKLSFSSKSLAQIMLLRLQKKGGDKIGIDDKVIVLELYGICRHSARRLWSTIIMKEGDENNPGLRSALQVEKSVLQSFRIQGMNATVHAMYHNNLLWLTVVEKRLTRRRGVRLQQPVFFALATDDPYLLYAPKSVSSKKNVIQAVVSGLKYKSWKTNNLDGRNVTCLMHLLKKKSETHGKYTEVPFVPAVDVVKTNFTTDYTLGDERRRHAEKVLGENIDLQAFSVNALISKWQAEDCTPQFADQLFPATMRLESHNVGDIIKQMVERGMMPSALPDYIMGLPYRGKNVVLLTGRDWNAKNHNR